MALLSTILAHIGCSSSKFQSVCECFVDSCGVEQGPLAKCGLGAKRSKNMLGRPYLHAKQLEQNGALLSFPRFRISFRGDESFWLGDFAGVAPHSCPLPHPLSPYKYRPRHDSKTLTPKWGIWHRHRHRQGHQATK